MKSPRLWVIAGPNGAGKSTLVGARLKRYLPVVNPDDIARDLPEDHQRAARAGRMALREREALLAARQTFAIETTLSGAGGLRFIARCKAAGSRVMFIFIGLDSPGLSRMRVLDRVEKGGHDVPVVDKSGWRRRVVYSRDQGRTRFLVSDPPAWSIGAISEGN